MSLKIDRVKVTVETDAGSYGTDISFTAGLNLVRADNSSGKSSCFQSIIYALGLDQMLTNRQYQLPLQPALCSRIFDPALEEEVAVRNSIVELQIRNPGRNSLATIRRQLWGKEDNRLVRVFEGCSLDQSECDIKPLELAARISGAAVRPFGFEHWLASFLGWDLPEVETNDGGLTRLYLATIFPLFFVEQRFGWARIQGNMPYVFGIKDVARRAAEFVLSMSSSGADVEKNRAIEERRRLEDQYTALYVRMTTLAESAGVVLRGFPERISKGSISPVVSINSDGKWIELDAYVVLTKARIAELRTRMKSGRKKTSSQLASLQDKRATLLTKRDELRRRERSDAQEIASLTQRVAVLDDDLSKLRDLKSLATVGSNIDEMLRPANCPTCWQRLSDSVVPGQSPILTLDETIGLLKSELALAESSALDSRIRKRSSSIERNSIDRELSLIDSTIESAEDVASSTVDAEAIGELVGLTDDFKRVEHLSRQLDEVVKEANVCTEQYQQVTKLIDQAGRKTSHEDKRKLSEFQDVFRELESQYGFQSYQNVDEITISPETLRPTVDGFELSYETSASDAIRTIWSYLVALLECRRSFPDMHHSRLLIFDEPRQQHASGGSFDQLLRRAALAQQFDEQIIFFTSEKRENLQHALQGVKVNVADYDGRMLLRPPTKQRHQAL